MEISNFTLIVTDDCNFNCSYCFQKKEKKYMDNTTIKTAVDFFFPFLKSDDKINISFYGGEPLLAFEQIKYAALLMQEKNSSENKNLEFNVTTNGSLLTDEILDFFNRSRFGVMLSFDGIAQEKGRKKGTLDQTVRLMKCLQDQPGIDFEINSVFTPETIGDLTDSLRFIIDREGPEVTYNISTMAEWTPAHLERLKKELERLTGFLVSFYKKKGTVPVKNFQAYVPGSRENKEKTNKRIFRCNAGKDRMAVTPEGKLWGCFLFHDYFKTRENHPQYRDYFLGTLTDFIANYETCYPGILANYSELRQDLFRVNKKNPVENEKNDYCFLCEDIAGCVVCPINAAYTSGALGKVPYHKCQLIKIQRHAQENFRQKLLALSP